MSHLRSRISRSHTFLSGSNIKTPKKKEGWTYHSEEFIYPCEDCEQLTCRLCVWRVCVRVCVRENCRKYIIITYWGVNWIYLFTSERKVNIPDIQIWYFNVYHNIRWIHSLVTEIFFFLKHGSTLYSHNSGMFFVNNTKAFESKYYSKYCRILTSCNCVVISFLQAH